MTLRVLCLDIEGGFGGSSRSLYESIRHIDRTRVVPEVWCGRDGPVVPRYESLGVPCRVISWPRFSALPRLSRNLYALGRAKMNHIRLRPAIDDLVRIASERFDVIHANHESLFLILAALRQRTDLPLIMHLRTIVAPSVVARWQARSISHSADHAVFITENERDAWSRLGLQLPDRSVIYNIAVPPDVDISAHPSVPDDERFRVACISNYAWVRGIDRLVEVARLLKSRSRSDVRFVLAGDMRLRGSLPGELGRIAARGGSLADYAAAHGVDDMFTFVGHVAEPEQVLVACDAVARPSRENNPWGRETIEAMAAGKPVISTGTYDRFVEDGVTGLLHAGYDPAAFAGAITQMADDRALCARLGAEGRRRVETLCNGPARAEDLLGVWTMAAMHGAKFRLEREAETGNAELPARRGNVVSAGR